ncbi:hypothetical protein L1887_45172 [Cichorium endivia]|nr:hypothetical protein L1887_45172 [Cichorium endivia]
MADAPEIDGAVYLNGETSVKPGDIIRVKVENADDASRSPSPSRLNASTVRKMARLGKIATCGAITISALASFSIAPHSGVGGCAPSPRNDRLAAEIIDTPMRMVK